MILSMEDSEAWAGLDAEGVVGGLGGGVAGGGIFMEEERSEDDDDADMVRLLSFCALSIMEVWLSSSANPCFDMQKVLELTMAKGGGSLTGVGGSSAMSWGASSGPKEEVMEEHMASSSDWSSPRARPPDESSSVPLPSFSVAEDAEEEDAAMAAAEDVAAMVDEEGVLQEASSSVLSARLSSVASMVVS